MKHDPRLSVRRLTPLECERLQGFPDHWTDIGEDVWKEVADYKYVFDESKYMAPNPEDFGLTELMIQRNAAADADYEPDDEDYIDEDADDGLQTAYRNYLDAVYCARKAATRKVKIGTHKELVRCWTDENGKTHKVSDSHRYKALGNSIALPFWRWLIKRMSAQYETGAPTMCSLFDGIGGFPYLWESVNGKGTAVWASEIEEFPIAVTKIRIGDE